MKQLAAYFLIAITLSGCLKETIPGAMLRAEEQSAQGSPISMSYKVNGVLVKSVVNDVSNNRGSYHQLSCEKATYAVNNMNYYRYVLSLVSSSGDLTFLFYTDSLQTKNYEFRGSYGVEHFLSYNNTNGYTAYASDNMIFNITSYTNRRISGNFSGKLTPGTTGSTSNTYGTAGSILITEGTFENIPVFYQ